MKKNYTNSKFQSKNFFPEDFFQITEKQKEIIPVTSNNLEKNYKSHPKIITYPPNINLAFSFKEIKEEIQEENNLNEDYQQIKPNGKFSNQNLNFDSDLLEDPSTSGSSQAPFNNLIKKYNNFISEEDLNQNNNEELKFSFCCKNSNKSYNEDDNEFLYKQTAHFCNFDKEDNYRNFKSDEINNHENIDNNNNNYNIYIKDKRIKGKSEKKKIKQPPYSTRNINKKFSFEKNDIIEKSSSNNKYMNNNSNNNHLKNKNNKIQTKRNCSQRLLTAPNSNRNKTPIKKKKSFKNEKDNIKNNDTQQKVENELNNLMNLIPDEFYNDPIIKNKFESIMKNIDDIKHFVNQKAKKKNNFLKDNYVKIIPKEKNKKMPLNQAKKNY